MAIGAPRNDGNGSFSGHVRVHRWNGNAWVQKGNDIDGEAIYNRFGFSVSMPDSNTVAAGTPFNWDNGRREAGHVRIYQWNGSSWVQKGGDIDGDTTNCSSGFSVCMADSNTVVIGAPNHDLGGLPFYNIGQIKVYQWNGVSWVQKGSDIDGIAIGDQFGRSLSMPDSNTLAIAAPLNDSNGTDAGLVRVYRWNGLSWAQKGMDFIGDTAGDYLGYSVSMPNSNTVAIGIPLNDSFGVNTGLVRIYKWNGTVWVQKGSGIGGETAGDVFGISVSMPDSNTVAVGGTSNDGNGTDAGHVRIYKWNGVNWQQNGRDIDGEAAGDRSGWPIDMPDSNTVVIGSYLNSGNGTNAGHVRIYSICNNSVDTSVTFSGNTLIANDSTASYQWVNCDSAYAAVSGEINRSFTPSINGNYSVIVSRSHCVDTSACYNVVVTGMSEEKAKKEKFIVYPNPTNGAFTIESNDINNNTPFEIRDIRGKVVHKGKLNGNRTAVDLSDYSNGVYLLRVGDQNIKVVRK